MFIALLVHAVAERRQEPACGGAKSGVSDEDDLFGAPTPGTGDAGKRPGALERAPRAGSTRLSGSPRDRSRAVSARGTGSPGPLGTRCRRSFRVVDLRRE